MTRSSSAVAVVLAAGCLFGLNGCASKNADSVKLQGVGATFPEPIYKRWFADYNKKHPNVIVNYGGKGSSAGVKEFTEGMCDFGASDAAMSDDEMKKVPNDNVYLLPMTAGGIVLAYNHPDIKDLKLSRKAYAGIFNGTITKWNDPEIVKDNPAMPDEPISVVVRADGSGTTYAFSNHLSAIDPDFKSKRGVSKQIQWPKEGLTGAKGNAAVAAQISQNKGTIGYVEYGFATKSDKPLAMVTLENKSGEFVKPSPESCQAALAGEKFPDDMRLFVADPSAKNAYPIVTYTWILAKKEYDNEKTAKNVKDLLKYCLTDGQKCAEELGYIPLPEDAAKEVIKVVEKIHN